MTPLRPKIRRARARWSLRFGIAAGALASGLTLGACTPAGFLNVGSRIVGGGDRGVRIARALPFGNDPRQKLDVWAPEGGAKDAPVVVFFYGGGWVSGRRQDYGFVGRALAARGFVTVIPDYRLVPDHLFPAFVEDGAAAVAFAARHASAWGGDPARLAVMGHSAGAYNAAMVALDAQWLAKAGAPEGVVKAGVLLAGPFDFYPFIAGRGRDALSQWPNPRETQPINYARADAPPLLMLTGSDDYVVRPRNSRRLFEALRAAGAEAEIKVYRGEKHTDLIKSVSPVFRGQNPALADSVDFLERYIGAAGSR